MSGQLIILTGDGVRQAVELVKWAGSQPRLYEVFVRQHARRDQHQNRRYWGLLRDISKHTGDSSASLHAFYATTFLGLNVKTIMGIERAIPWTTSELTPTDFQTYLMQIEAHAITQQNAVLTPGAAMAA